MKISLARGPRQPLSRQTAWGCLTTNLALPGFGSLVAGRAAGYAQAALAVAGLALSLIFGVRFIAWYFANWRRFNSDQSDPFVALGAMWKAVRWPLLGIAVFLISWLWALITSLQILRQATQPPPPPAENVPPRLA